MRELIRYLICGLLTTVVSLASYYAASMVLGTDSTIHLQACNVVSWALAVLFAFFLSRVWVFQSKSKKISNEFFAFVSGRIFTLLCDMAIMQILVFELQISDLYAKLVVQVVVTILNYIFGKLVFRRKRNG